MLKRVNNVLSWEKLDAPSKESQVQLFTLISELNCYFCLDQNDVHNRRVNNFLSWDAGWIKFLCSSTVQLFF